MYDWQFLSLQLARNSSWKACGCSMNVRGSDMLNCLWHATEVLPGIFSRRAAKRFAYKYINRLRIFSWITVSFQNRKLNTCINTYNYCY
jgi:hypothetical protein